MHTAFANPDRFQPPTFAEQAGDDSDAREQQLRHECALGKAQSAMCAGLPILLVDRHADEQETLADMLSMHTCNYTASIPGPNPCELLAVMLAEALQRGCPAAKSYAARIALEYATAHEVRA